MLMSCCVARLALAALMATGLPNPEPPAVVPMAGEQTPVAALMPAEHALAAGAPLRLSWRAEHEVPRWPVEQMKHAFVRGEGTQENFDSVPSVDGTWAELVVGDPGVYVVGVTVEESQAAVGDGDAGRLGDAAGKLAPGQRLRRVACGKALVQVLEADAAQGQERHPRMRRSAAATSKCGQPAELRPMMDPTFGPMPRDIPVRVFAGGGARGGSVLRVRVLDDAGTKVFETSITANAEGIANLTLDRAGVWVVESEELVEAGGEVTWYQASLNFRAVAP